MNVAISYEGTARYPEQPPFDPEEAYPELRRLYGGRSASGTKNDVYRLVRDALARLGLDRGRIGTPDWNPLTEVVRRGERIVIKPNLVTHEVSRVAGGRAVFTHASVLRPIIDYVLLATGGDCRLIVADCPIQEADLSRLMAANGLDALLEFYRRELKIPLEFADLRRDRMVMREDGLITDRTTAPGDPRGDVTVRVDRHSELEPVTRTSGQFGIGYQQAFAVATYDKERTASHHGPGKHEYLISRTILESDILINVPKLKTHQKAGITVCMKNMIGINTDKSYLPHYREGTPDRGGDEFPHYHWLTDLNARVRKKLCEGNPLVWAVMSRSWGLMKRHLLTRRVLGQDSKFVDNLNMVAAGAWSGNDTIWRTILDINKILFFADANGALRDEPQRRHFAVVDGIVGGEGNGPILPDPKHCGMILAGDDPLAVDVVAARVMGFDWTRIPQLVRGAALSHGRFSAFAGDPAAIRVVSSDRRFEDLFSHDEHLGLRPPPGWDTLPLRPAAELAGAVPQR